MAQIEPIDLGVLDAADGTDFVVLVWQDQRPLGGAGAYLDWRLCGRLSALVLAGHFEGKVGEQVLMPSRGRLRGRRISIVGVGASGGQPDEQVLSGIGQRLAQAGQRDVTVFLPGFERPNKEESAFAKALASAWGNTVKVRRFFGVGEASA